ncbi:hypothetical protein, partial [[Clostridium] symbiosum]
NGDLKTGYVEIPAGDDVGSISFATAFKDSGYNVLLTNVFLNTRKVIFSVAGLTASGFNIYPVDPVTGEPPEVVTRALWLAIRGRS